MGWQRYDLRFRLQSPLHIGWRKSGNLQQTRGYVPGKNVWAALTARLTRQAGRGAAGSAYEEIGKLVQDNFRFSYLYPALKSGSGYQVHYPWDEGFDYLFLDSYTSTALAYPSQSAAEGLLHETEFIAPRTRQGDPVYLTGCLYVQTELPAALHKWHEALAKLQFGGERGYGWGRVEVMDDLQGVAVNGEPAVKLTDGCKITAHLVAAEVSDVSGPVEPFIGWERNNNEDEKANWRLGSEALICYAPGSVATADATFTIGPNGIWEAATP